MKSIFRKSPKAYEVGGQIFIEKDGELYVLFGTLAILVSYSLPPIKEENDNH